MLWKWWSTVNIKADQSNNTLFDKFAWNINYVKFWLTPWFRGWWWWGWVFCSYHPHSCCCTWSCTGWWWTQYPPENMQHWCSNTLALFLFDFHSRQSWNLNTSQRFFYPTRGRCFDNLIWQPNILSINPLGPDCTCIFIYLCAFYAELHWTQLLICYQLNRVTVCSV